MAIAILTIFKETGTFGKEFEPLTGFSQIVYIDPDDVIKGEYKPKIHLKDKGFIREDLLDLHAFMSRLANLLKKSPGLKNVLGGDQIVQVGNLEDVLITKPDTPVLLDAFDLTLEDELPPLLKIGVTIGEVIPLPVLSVEFLPNPQRLATSPFGVPQIRLREARRGERMDPIFYHTDDLPQNIGRVDAEGYRGGPSPTFTVLSYGPSPNFQITKEAVGILDSYAGCYQR